MTSAIHMLIVGGIMLNLEEDRWENEIYKGCGQKDKTCYGDVEGCIANKNCTFVATAAETSTHYLAEIQNNCYMEERYSKNAFLGVGVDALIKKNPPTSKCTPKLKDFRFIILWEGEKCRNPKSPFRKSAWMEKGHFPNCTRPPPIKSLLEFSQEHSLVEDGYIYRFLIGKNKYVEKNKGAFFRGI